MVLDFPIDLHRPPSSAIMLQIAFSVIAQDILNCEHRPIKVLLKAIRALASVQTCNSAWLEEEKIG